LAIANQDHRMPAASLVQPLFDDPIDIVADVHGEADALRELLGQLGYDSAGVHPEGRRLVFLGDLTDRGPDSPGVVRLVAGLLDAGLAQCVLGNHELNLLQGKHKHGNAWFFGQREVLDYTGRVVPQALADEATRQSTLALFRRLPLALERSDLRIVHACWDGAAIERARTESDVVAFVQREQQRIDAALSAFSGQEQDVPALLDALGLSEATARATLAAPGQEAGPLARFLADRARHALVRQNANPVKLLVSGLEGRVVRPFWASGKWRHEGRRAWWDGYRDEAWCIIGHYWRRRLAGEVEGEHLFDDARPYSTLGPGRVMCIDYSAGKRWKERPAAPGDRPWQTTLAALRWPQRWLHFDTGRPVPLVTSEPPRDVLALLGRFRALARESFTAAEQQAGNAGSILYLLSAEQLLKARVIETMGDLPGDLEQTHDLGQLLAALVIADENLRELANIDPGAFHRVQRLCRRLWERFGGDAGPLP
jgi:hypothetical protein